MMRSRLVSTVLLVIATLLCPMRPAEAKLPAVMDRVPPDAAAVVCIPNLDTMNEHTLQLISSMELTISSLDQILGVIGVRRSIDLSGAAAFVMFEAEDGAPAFADWLLLLPTTDGPPLAEALRAVPDGEIQRFEFNGMQLWHRQVSADVAAIGPKARVDAYQGTPGNLAHYDTMLGETGARVATDADVFMVADVDKSGAMLDGFRNGVRAGLGNMPLPFGASMFESVANVLVHNADLLESSGESATIGLRASSLGLRIDLGAAFDPESEFGSALAVEPLADAARLNAIADRPFVAAGWARMDQDVLGMMMPASEADSGVALVSGMLEGTQEMEFVMHAPRTLTSGVIASGLVHWRGQEPDAVRTRFRTWLDGHEQPLRVNYAPGAAKSGADIWSITGPPRQQFGRSAWLFGSPRGPQGLIHVTENDGYLVGSNNDELLTASMAAARGEQTALKDNVIVAQLMGLVRQDPDAMLLVNLEPVLPEARQFLQALMGIALRVPAQTPPMIGSLHMDEHATHASFYVPAPDLRLFLNIYEAFKPMLQARPAAGQP